MIEAVHIAPAIVTREVAQTTEVVDAKPPPDTRIVNRNCHPESDAVEAPEIHPIEDNEKSGPSAVSAASSGGGKYPHGNDADLGPTGGVYLFMEEQTPFWVRFGGWLGLLSCVVVLVFSALLVIGFLQNDPNPLSLLPPLSNTSDSSSKY